MTTRALAVSAMRGVSRVSVSPENSAPSKRAAPDPTVGATATKRTTIPSPPSQWVMLGQKRMEGVWASMSERSVAPVVVKPLIDSKVESRRARERALDDVRDSAKQRRERPGQGH